MPQFQGQHLKGTSGSKESGSELENKSYHFIYIIWPMGMCIFNMLILGHLHSDWGRKDGFHLKDSADCR